MDDKSAEVSLHEINARMLALCAQRNAALDECALLRGLVARLEQQLQQLQHSERAQTVGSSTSPPGALRVAS
jgi:hypothetical protein